MQTLNCPESTAKLNETMDRVCTDHAPVILDRANSNHVVLISLEDYRSLEETAYLLSSPANAAWLAQSLAEADSGRTVGQRGKSRD